MLNFRSQLESLSQRLLRTLDRIEELSRPDTSDTEGAREALLFNLERAAWAMIEMAAAWVFELRLGIARKETENFDLLVQQGWLELDTGRKLKQLAEFRNLSSREPERIDRQYLAGGLSDELRLFRDWNVRALNWQHH
jgi:uncharacterized protein YutE (UPF0331/DUF86 family)